MSVALTEIRAAAKDATARLLRSYAQRVLERADASRLDAARLTKYALISTPRVGSTMFSRKLEQTGRLGWPTEWLNDRYAAAFTEVTGERLRVEAYLDLIARGTATPNGVFGVSFHIHQYQLWRQRGIDPLALGFKKIYWIERRDRFAQAYSYAKGLKTDLWSKEFEVAAGFPDGVPVEVTQDEVAQALSVLSKELAAGRGLEERASRRFFYEDLVPDQCVEAVDSVLADFGEPPVPPSKQGLRRQSSDADEEQREALRRLFPEA